MRLTHGEQMRGSVALCLVEACMWSARHCEIRPLLGSMTAFAEGRTGYPIINVPSPASSNYGLRPGARREGKNTKEAIGKTGWK